MSGEKAGGSAGANRKDAITEPGVGKPSRPPDTVDLLLEGFGPNRADQPRVRRPARKEDTPTPAAPGRKELTPTEPSARERRRAIILALVVTFLVVTALGIALVKLAAK